MNTRRAFCAAVILGWSVIVALASEKLSRVWRDPNATVQQRAAAVNRAFTNGTPVSVVVAALGTNYALCGSSARLWAGPPPKPPNTFWLSYQFGKDEVTLGTSAVFGRDLDILACKFTGAGYSLAPKNNHF
jgi:hypothetical protein